MNASDAISELQKLIDEHGDLELTVAIGSYEYALRLLGFAEEGPLPMGSAAQAQNDFPARIVFEGKDRY